MKFITSELTYFFRNRTTRTNIRLLLRFLLILTVLVVAYSIIFHVLMQREGREYSWVTGFYWTLTVMSTLGFGDITFTSDIGRIFSIAVLLSGIVFLLVLLPFTFINFFYAPWMEAQSAARTPRRLPESVRGHVILTRYGPVTSVLIRKLEHHQIPYVVVLPDIDEALRLHDAGIRVMVGELDNPETYEKARVQQAALVATTAGDTLNTNVAFTVREISKSVPIVATANEPASVDILSLAGCNHVLQWGEMMGRLFARHTVGGDAIAHVIGRMEGILIAEANASGTPLVGRTLQEARLEEITGVAVLGVLERGEFEFGAPETQIGQRSVLLLAGSREEIEKYNSLFAIYHVVDAPVIIIGGGRVGRATGRMLAERKIDYRIIEKLPERIRDRNHYVLGDAANLEVLQEAGIMKTPAVLITTHDDDTNIYLTLYCRKLRPEIQIISRATLERNAPTLNRAGADFVLSYGSMGASTIFNLLRRGSMLMVDEGLVAFKVPLPKELADKSIAETGIQAASGCWIIGIKSRDGVQLKPDASAILTAGTEIILMGSVEAEYAFMEQFART